VTLENANAGKNNDTASIVFKILLTLFLLHDIDITLIINITM